MHIKQTIIALALSLTCNAVNALPSDKAQPINVSADSAEKDQKTNTTTLIGTVEIGQGSIRIKADKAIIHYQGSQISKIVCYGKPAHFQQQMNPGEGLLIGKADQIHYNQKDNELKLRENANVLKPDGSTLASNSIDYSLTNESMNADGRVQLVIPPNQTQGE